MLKQKPFLIIVTVLLIAISIFSACKKDNNNNSENLITGPNINAYALTNDNKLLLFNAQNPNMITSQVAITGLQSGEIILGIDFRPATGQLYGLGNSSRIYVIDHKTGVASN